MTKRLILLARIWLLALFAVDFSVVIWTELARLNIILLDSGLELWIKLQIKRYWNMIFIKQNINLCSFIMFMNLNFAFLNFFSRPVENEYKAVCWQSARDLS